MSHHTPQWQHVYKLWTIVLIVIAPLVIIFPLLPVLIGSLIGVAVMMYGIAFCVRAVLWLTHGNEPAYRKFRQGGGCPFFDWHLGWIGFNRDSFAVVNGGRPEPQTDFVPPEDWLWQCNSCGARNEAPQGACWHCGNNLSNEPQQQGGRLFGCFNCHRNVREADYGDLDNGGVTCPFCGATNLAAM
jgi:hypothetical protein